MVPVIAGGARQYIVREDDLMTVIAALATGRGTADQETIFCRISIPCLASGSVESVRAPEGRRCRLVPVPWQLVYALLRAAELLRLRLPFRADSLLGLVRTASGVGGGEALAGLGVTLHAFPFDPADRG